ncbi:MAG: HD domain-containing protein [Nitrospirae bacterium]|nr:HD domain-containing protein [Nitrospirota bacterium]
MAAKEDISITRISKDIINQLAVVIRNAQIHAPNNVAVLTAVDKFTSMINPLLSDSRETFTLELLGEFFYVNDMRISYPMEYLLNFAFLISEFKKRKMGGMKITGPLNSEDMQIFLKAFISSALSYDPFKTLSDGILDIKQLDVTSPQKIKEDKADIGEESNIRKQVKKTYFNAVSYTKGFMNKLSSGETINIKKAKRIVESMVDLILHEEELLLGMTAIKNYDEYTYHHSVNVSILSVAFGQRLGLSRNALTELGLVALFHDTGKVEVPPETLNKPSELNENDWVVMKKHPFWGAKTILKLKGLDNISLRSAIVAFEHHLNYDMSGYPKVSPPFEPDFFSKIVSLADGYDAMTSARVYLRIPTAPNDAISAMVKGAGTQYDPVLVKFFATMVGALPVGSLVLLDTKEFGIVFKSNTVLSNRPIVLILVDSSGNKIKGLMADLAEKDNNGKYLRTPIKTLDPNKYNIDLAEYLLFEGI